MKRVPYNVTTIPVYEHTTSHGNDCARFLMLRSYGRERVHAPLGHQIYKALYGGSGTLTLFDLCPCPGCAS